MYRSLSSALVLSLSLISPAAARADDGNEKKQVLDPLPRTPAVQWDVRHFEDGPAFAVVKREVKGNKITWVLENKRALGTEITFGYQAALFDDDGVKLGQIDIETEPWFLNLSKGERNRFVLHLPPAEKWKAVRKVVITNGNLGN